MMINLLKNKLKFYLKRKKIDSAERVFFHPRFTPTQSRQQSRQGSGNILLNKIFSTSIFIFKYVIFSCNYPD